MALGVKTTLPFAMVMLPYATPVLSTASADTAVMLVAPLSLAIRLLVLMLSGVSSLVPNAKVVWLAATNWPVARSKR